MDSTRLRVCCLALLAAHKPHPHCEFHLERTVGSHPRERGGEWVAAKMFSRTGEGSTVSEGQLPIDIQYSQLMGWLVRTLAMRHPVNSTMRSTACDCVHPSPRPPAAALSLIDTSPRGEITERWAAGSLQVDRKKIPTDWRKRLTLVQARTAVAYKTLPTTLTSKVRNPSRVSSVVALLGCTDGTGMWRYSSLAARHPRSPVRLQ